MIDVAVTFDDLPGRANGPGEPRADLEAIVDALAQHRVPTTFGFVAGGALEGPPHAHALVDAWVAAGHRLGNHTYSHPDLHAIGPEVFLQDVDRNEAVLQRWGSAFTARRMFRFPYLNAGETTAQRQTVRAALAHRHYTIAEATVDFGDWRWNHGLEPAGTFVDAGVAALRQARTLAGVLFRRAIRHILLLHFGSGTAFRLDELLGAYEREGVRFITLEHALDDRAYAIDAVAVPSVGTFLNKLGRSGLADQARA